ncbi:ATP-binding cassette domain-containing protein [Fodinicurvata halophila]|uniref:ATP-binding cassette domain-containing protein n=1 Tax=Fodinicurvata halophila TaxID=1419723 RepID=UPI00362600A4
MGLEVSDVVAGYTREVPILNGLNLTAEDGRVTVIIGPNGAGKSTLLKTIYGYLKPERGSISHDGESILGYAPKDMLRKGIAYLIQGHSVFPRMLVEENLELGGWILGSERERREALERVYERYPRLKEKRRLPAGILSGASSAYSRLRV